MGEGMVSMDIKKGVHMDYCIVNGIKGGDVYKGSRRDRDGGDGGRL